MQNLRRMREAKGLTQKEMAEKLQVSKPTYCHYETGRYEPDIKTILWLSNFFDCSIDYLLGHQSSNIVHLDSFTAEQKDLIDTILQLSAEGCGRVQAYAEGLLTAEEEKAATIRKFRR